jgi:hypothetical protein
MPKMVTTRPCHDGTMMTSFECSSEHGLHRLVEFIACLWMYIRALPEQVLLRRGVRRAPYSDTCMSALNLGKVSYRDFNLIGKLESVGYLAGLQKSRN